MKAHMIGLEEIERKKVKYKYDNCVRVSYPTKMYVLIREQAMKESLSIQDLQRKAMDYYLTFSANKKV